MRIPGGAIALLLCSAAACGSKNEDASKKAPPPPAAGDDGGAAADEPAPPRLEPIAEADARAVVDRWLAAQNEGDFDAYAALYADRFTGVKRVGARTFRYDHDGWLKDRKRMFASPVQVSLADVAIRTTPHLATATFEQTWESGKFKDVGPKRLLIIRQGDGLRIGNEEMLRSEVRSGAQANTDVMLTLDGDDGLFVVLEQEVDEAWPVGPARWVALGIDEVYGTIRDAALDRLPGTLRAWKGKMVTAHDASGTACTGTIESLHVIAGVDAHWSVDAAMDHDEASGSPPKPQELWDLAEYGRVLVGRVAAAKGCSRGNLYAYPGEPRTISSLSPARTTNTPVWSKFTRLPAFEDMQHEYEADGNRGRWDQTDDVRSFTLELLDEHEPPRTHLVVVAADAGPGCGHFGGELWAVYALDGDEIELRVDPAQQYPIYGVVTGADLDGDGAFELIGPRIILGLVDGTYRVIRRLEFPSHDSPC